MRTHRDLALPHAAASPSPAAQAVQRRQRLLGLAALLWTAATSACGAGGPTVPYEEPAQLVPNALGVYELHFAPTEVTVDGKRYCVRGYNGHVPGPTIRVPAGTDRRIRVKLFNEFARPDFREIAGMEGYAEKSCHDFNLTNLHAHGAHVQPNYATALPYDPCMGDGCGPGGTYYGDNVLHEVSVGQTAQYRWDLDEDGTHDPGTNWYHPHIHGSTAIQVIGGATGALIVEGDLDKVPGIAGAKERVMVLNQLPIHSAQTTPLPDGVACSEATLSVNNFLTVSQDNPTLINGKLRPRIVTPPGQLERWRMIYAGNPDEMGLKLHPALDDNCNAWDVTSPLEMVQIARDGQTLPQFYRSDTAWLSPGYRIEALFKMPMEKKKLCLVARRVRDPLGSVIAVVDVDPAAGAPTEVNLPQESALSAIARPTSWAGTVAGQAMQVSCDTVKTPQQKVVLLVPTTDNSPTIGPQPTLASCDPAAYHHQHEINPNLAVCNCPSPNISCRRFDERRAWGYRSDRVMTVGTSEKWQINALDGHPFHVHINPFVVCPTNSNKEPNFAHWRDTYWVQFEDGPRDLLMNFRKFTGQFVMHCHKLNHEDEGMMELLEICAPGDQACLCQGTDANGACISQADCQAADKRCQFAKAATAAYPAPPAPNPMLCGS